MSDTSSSDGEVEGMPFSMHDILISDLIFEDSSFARGAFGRMVKADYFGVTVCVKILKKQKKKELSKFIHREMAALKTLSHPNLVQFIGLTDKGNEFCLVTEFISGGTLRKLLKDRSINIPWPLRVQIAVDIASAMTYLHSRKIMHRDLKSKNLLVGDNWKVKICDFGFARSVHDKKKAAALTFCGTEEYMAPEVIFGMEYDERAEVYSYGLLLCEIMTRQKVEETVPRTSNTNYGLDHQEFTSHVPRDCPLELLQLAFLCTEFEPKNRPEFREITQLLREIKQNVNTSASPVFGQYAPGGGQPNANPAASPQQQPVHQNHQQPSAPQHQQQHANNSHHNQQAHNMPAQPAAPAPSARTPSPPVAVSPHPVTTTTSTNHQSPAPAVVNPPPTQEFTPLPPPITLSGDDLLPPPPEQSVPELPHQNGNNKPTSPTPIRNPQIERPSNMRRSPSAPIPMPNKSPAVGAKASGSNLKDTTNAKPPPGVRVVSKEVPASAKLGRPAPTKTSPAPISQVVRATPPTQASKPAAGTTNEFDAGNRPSANTFPTPKVVPSTPSPSSPALPSSPPSSTVGMRSKPAATATATTTVVSPRTAVAPAPTAKAPASVSPVVPPPKSGTASPTPPKSGVPVLPKVPSSVGVSSPNGSPRTAATAVPGSAKDRPIPQPAPPARTGRTGLPFEGVPQDKKR